MGILGDGGALWRWTVFGVRLLLLMGAFLGMVVPADNATGLAEVRDSSSAVTGRMDNVGRAMGTSLGVAVTAMGVHVATLHRWAGPDVVLPVLAVFALALAATALSRPTTSGRRMAGIAP